jgi:hypothetical protein
MEDGYQATRQLLEEHHDFTAMAVASDVMEIREQETDSSNLLAHIQYEALTCLLDSKGEESYATTISLRRAL